MELAVSGAVRVLEACGRAPSIRNIAAIIAAGNDGRAVRWSTLRPVVENAVRNPVGATVGQQSGNAFEHGGQQSGTLHARDIIVSPSENEEATREGVRTNVLTPKRSVSAPVKPTVSAVDFAELEPDVEVYVANAAHENKSGKITSGRVVGLRRELWAELERIGSRASFAVGLRIANAKGAANPMYVRKAAERHLAGSRPPDPMQTGLRFASERDPAEVEAAIRRHARPR